MSLYVINGKPLLVGGKALCDVLPTIQGGQGTASPAGALGITADIRNTYAGAAVNPPYIHPVANLYTANATAPVIFTISDPAGIYIVSGSTIYQNTSNPAVGSYPISVTATEQGTGRTATATITLPCVAGLGIYVNQTKISNATDPGFKFSMNAGGVNDFTPTWSMSDPSGRFYVDPQYWYFAFTNGVPPVGSYPVTIKTTANDGTALSNNFTLTIYQEAPQTAPVFTPIQVSSADVAGTAIGKLSAFNALGVYNYSITDATGYVKTVVDADGTVRIAKDLPPVGNLTFTATVSNGVTSATASCVVLVKQGNVLPPANMMLAVNSALENYSYGQVIGTPTISGITGTPQWTLRHESDAYVDYFNNPQKCFNIDPSTGQITAPYQLPARCPNHPVVSTPGHSIQVTCSDGTNRCTQTFTVPVYWKTGGPTVYVGRGMKSLHGANGYEHWTDFLPLVSPQNGILDAAYAGAVINIAADSDPNYYACDNANGQNGFAANYAVRQGIGGPLTIQALDPNGPRPRMGGLVGSGSGGVDISGKGFFNFANGDQILKGIEVSFVNGAGEPEPGDNTHGVSGVRKNGQCLGDFFVVGCNLHDCNNNIETGLRPGNDYIYNNILGNGGTAYVSSGATHNLYAGATPYLHFKGNLTYRAMNGHALKTRSFSGLIENNRLYDAENGSSSAVVDVPQGGQYVFRNNQFHKGPNAQNSGTLQILGDGDRQRVHTFDIYGNVFSVQSLSEHYGAPSIIKNVPVLSLIDGKDSIVTVHDNSYYLAGQGARLIENLPIGSGSNATSNVPPVVGTNTQLTAPPALDFSDPGTASPAAGRLGFYNAIQEQDVNNNYNNYYMTQTDAGFDDIRVPATAAVGTVVAHLTAYGANLWANVTPVDQTKVNPFSGGAAFSLTSSLDPSYSGPANPFAANSKYKIVATSATTADIQVVAPLTAGTDFIKIRATSPNGVLADTRYYVSVV